VKGLALMIRRFTSYGAAKLSTAIPQKVGDLGRSQILGQKPADLQASL
jgi:hypothetical protein